MPHRVVPLLRSIGIVSVSHFAPSNLAGAQLGLDTGGSISPDAEPQVHGSFGSEGGRHHNPLEQEERRCSSRGDFADCHRQRQMLPDWRRGGHMQ